MTPSATAAATQTYDAVAFVGDEHGMLLAGPAEQSGTEVLAAHTARLGPVPTVRDEALIEALTASGLSGRGGGAFPFGRKVAAVRTAVGAGRGEAVVVVNASESEPLSRKDEVLTRLRPQLVLDGAALAAAAVGAREVVIRLHAGRTGHADLLRQAIAQRWALTADPRWRLSLGPDSYVAGESGAIVSALEGGAALPRSSALPLAIEGLHGRPTLLSNAETFAHAGLIVRIGPEAWRGGRGAPCTGPSLFTVSGPGGHRPTVVEVVAPATIADVLAEVLGQGAPYGPVLVGGLSGTWLTGPRTDQLLANRAVMQAAGIPAGCGQLAAFPADACGITETAGLVRWLSAQSAGQCGPCMFGLPWISRALDELARGTAGRRVVSRITAVANEVQGRGACHHPDGVLALVRSMLTVFADDVDQHRRGRPCPTTARPGAFPLDRKWRP